MIERSTIELVIQRQDGPESEPYRETFRLPYRPHQNVISCLMEIRRNPVNAAGNRVAPPVWDSNCLEEVCGACTMLINGRPRQSCTALIDKLPPGPIELRPLSKYPCVRDLVVDRGQMFTDLKRVKAWVPIDGTYDLGPGPAMSDELRSFRYAVSRCMTCACCMEACPQVNGRSQFMGPALLAQSYLFLSHPTGARNSKERLDAVMGTGGVEDCGNSQNCVTVCPKEVPLVEAIARLNRETTKRWFLNLLGR